MSVRQVIVVGGGPAGLLLGRYLQEHGIGYLLLERGKIAQAWRGMRPGMVLLSPSVPGTDWTSLTLDAPLWAMPGTRRPFPTREDFLCYVEAFSRANRVRVSENTAVLRAAVDDGAFRVTTSAGEERCRFLVYATGASSAPDVPKVRGIAGNPIVIHSGDFVSCAAYDGRRVLILGAGNSAAEIAIELAGTAHVTMCTRDLIRYFSETGSLEDIRGSSESLLKELFRFGIVAVREADPVVSVDDRAVRFRSGAEQEFDVIICATGYRPAMIPLEGATVETDRNGFPVIARTGESTVPGLYVCGSLARFNARCAFIHGFRNYVEKVFWDLADRL